LYRPHGNIFDCLISAFCGRAAQIILAKVQGSMPRGQPGLPRTSNEVIRQSIRVKLWWTTWASIGPKAYIKLIRRWD
jgi:hypothetical protein